MKKLDPRSVIIGFLVAVIGFMSMGATNTTFDSITVGSIKMKDEGFFLMNAENEVVLQIMASSLTNLTAFYNKKDQPMIFIGENDNGSGLIELNNDAGKTTVLLVNDKQGKGAISVYNENAEPMAILSSDIGGGRLDIRNKHAQTVIKLLMTTEADGGIILSDRYGEAQWAKTGKRE